MIRGRGSAGRSSPSADMLVLPPLGAAGKLTFKSHRSHSASRPACGTDMWAPMTSLDLGTKAPRLRQWDLGLGDFCRLDHFNDVGNTLHPSHVKPEKLAMGSRDPSQKVAIKPRRRKSALDQIKHAYLGTSGVATNSGEGAYDMLDQLSALCSSLGDSAEDEDTQCQRQLAGLKTGEDAVRYFARHGSNAKIKILYCNRSSSTDDSQHAPYSLVVVPENRVHADHFTVSASGVLHVCPGEMTEYVSLSEWMHHSLMFSVLSSMPFFKMYTFRKNFGHWRTNARYEAYCRQRQRLARSCLLAKPPFAKHIVSVYSLADEVKNVPILHLARNCVRLDEFADAQSMLGSNPVHGARVQLAEKHDAVIQVLDAVIRCVSAGVDELPARKSASTRRRALSMVQEKQEARDRARRRQIVEEDLAGLGKLIRLADFMLQSALVSLVIEAAHALRARVNVPNPLFSVSATLNPKGVGFDPSQSAFMETLHRLWEHMIQIVSSVPTFSTNSRLRIHLSEAQVQSQQTVEEVLSKCDGLKEHIESIEEGISTNLQAALVYAHEQYMPYHRIFEYGHIWDEVSYVQKAHSIESLTDEMKLLCEFKADMESFRSQRAVGLISVNGSDLRESLTPIPESALTALKQLLVKLACEQCARALQEVTAAIKALDARPPSREECAKLCNHAEQQLRDTDKLGEEVDGAYQFLDQIRGRVPVEDRVQLDVLQSKWHELAHTKLPQAKEYLDSLGTNFVVTIDNSTHAELDWSITGSATHGEELASLRADLAQEAVDGFKDALAGRSNVPERSRLMLGRIANESRRSDPG